MSQQQTFVIVGGGLAGAKAAETLREEGFDGRMVIVSAEPERPYERPPLSKEYLRGEAGGEKVYVHEGGDYADTDSGVGAGRAGGGGACSAATAARPGGRRGAGLGPPPPRRGARAPAAAHPRRRPRR